MPPPDPTPTSIILWKKPPEAAEHDRKVAATRAAEDDARLAMAEARKKQAELKHVGIDLVLTQFKKWLKLSAHPDFASAIGPIDPKVVLKIAEFVAKESRLDNGQATENIAHAIGPSLDFSKLSQAERDAWRELAMKAGGE